MYSRSPAAYEALKSFGILQLPSRSTLQAYTGAFLHEPGANFCCIADQVARYLLFCNDLEKNEQKKIPMKDGVLIFDEVKVINQLMWNSRSQKLIGICMSHLDQSSLADIISGNVCNYYYKQKLQAFILFYILCRTSRMMQLLSRYHIYCSFYGGT